MEDENKTPFWRTYFNDRQLKEIDFCRMYATDFGHGATNHNVMLIVPQMAELLDRAVLPFSEPKE